MCLVVDKRYLRISRARVKAFRSLKSACPVKPESPEHLKASRIIEACRESGWELFPNWKTIGERMSWLCKVGRIFRFRAGNHTKRPISPSRYKESNVRGCWFSARPPRNDGL